MSGGHAHAPSSEGGGSNLHLADNLISAGYDTLKTGKNALVNGSKALRSVWENVTGRVGDLLIKKPVSAALHLAGGPVAKIVDGTFSGVARALTLGKIKKLQPLATTFRTTDSIVASVVDSAVNLKFQKTSREWKGTRGYLKHVHGKLKNWKKTTEEAHKAKKTAKKEAKSHKVEHHAKDDHHGEKPKKEKHPEPHAPKAVPHEDHGHSVEKPKADAHTVEHKKEEHAPAVASHDSGHTDAHKEESHHDTAPTSTTHEDHGKPEEKHGEHHDHEAGHDTKKHTDEHTTKKKDEHAHTGH